MVKAKSFIEKFYVAFIGFLLYAPLLVLFVCSFNDSKSRTVWAASPCTGILIYFRMRKYFQP